MARSTVREATNTARINFGEKIGNDLVKMTSHMGSCPICIPLEGRIYSVSGNDARYPSLYGTALRSGYGNVHPNCGHSFGQYIEEFDGNVSANREFSNRSFDLLGDGWTKKQKDTAERSLRIYTEGQNKKRVLYQDRKQWRNYRSVLGDDAPKSFSGFARMKRANSLKYKDLKQEYRDVNWMKTAQQTKVVEKTHKVPPQGAANSVFDKIGKNGTIVSRRYYNANGHPKLDFDVIDHGNSARHPYVPHSHDWDYLNGKITHYDDRKASRAECIANEDIINDKTGY
ncbi:MAG: phage minor capsid protein [Christensenellaceae bacterium]